jgi:CO/xanthine dehydrogenase FAD-binding subunit
VCPSTGQPCGCGDAPDAAGVIASSSDHKAGAALGGVAPRRPSVEPIFPPELRRRAPAELTLPGPVATWHRPLTLGRLLALKREFPAAKLVVGNTEVGIEMKFKQAGYPVLIGATHVAELNALEVEAGGVRVGASLPLTSVLEGFLELAAALPRHQTSGLRAVAEQLRWFAGPPIRNGASLGGNICTASPISDLNPLWVAAGATFSLDGAATGPRDVPAADFFLDYRRTALAPHEVLVSVFMPFTKQFEYVKEFKQAHRRDDDIAIVNAGMRFALRPAAAGDGGWEVAEASIAYGGVAALTIPAPRAAAALAGRPLDGEALAAALLALQEDVQMEASAPGGMVEYRRSLAASFLFKGVLYAATQLEADAPAAAAAPLPFPDTYKSAAAPYHRPPSYGLQYTCAVPGGDVVGQPYRHQAADMQVSGEAQYVDDMPLPAGALHAVLVPSQRPHARLLSVDTAAAMAVPGVVGVYTAADIPGANDLGAVIHDETLFATVRGCSVGLRDVREGGGRLTRACISLPVGKRCSAVLAKLLSTDACAARARQVTSPRPPAASLAPLAAGPGHLRGAAHRHRGGRERGRRARGRARRGRPVRGPPGRPGHRRRHRGGVVLRGVGPRGGAGRRGRGAGARRRVRLRARGGGADGRAGALLPGAQRAYRGAPRKRRVRGVQLHPGEPPGRGAHAAIAPAPSVVLTLVSMVARAPRPSPPPPLPRPHHTHPPAARLLAVPGQAPALHLPRPGRPHAQGHRAM